MSTRILLVSLIIVLLVVGGLLVFNLLSTSKKGGTNTPAPTTTTVSGGGGVFPSSSFSPKPITLISSSKTTSPPVDPVIQYIEEHLVIRVERKTYHPGMTVEITIINNGSRTVELTNPPWAIYKLVNGKWIPVYEPTPGSIQAISSEIGNRETIILKPGENATWTWNITVGEIAPGTDNLVIKVDNRTSQLFGERLEKPMALFTIKY